MNEVVDILLGLLRHDCGSSFEQVTTKEWLEVINLAFEQGVEAISVDGYNSLLTAQLGARLVLETDQTLEDAKFEWFGSILQAEEDYSKHIAVLNQLVQLLKENGIDVLLLKGLGLSKYYPKPEHRPCGDIDIYTYGQDERVDEIARAYGCAVNQEYEKHSVFKYEGVTIENHRIYLDSFKTRNETKVQKFLYTISGDVLNENGYYTPSPFKNYFFLLCHMSRHFSEYECITLRHLMDWGLFLDGEKDNLKVNLIRRKLQEFNLEPCNDIFTSLAQDVTGRDLSQFIIYEVSPSVKQKFLDAILKSKYREAPTNFFQRIAYKLRLLLSNQWKYKYLGITFRERVLWSIKVHIKGIASIFNFTHRHRCQIKH